MLGDSIGEMFACYGAADAAIIGGSLLPYGGKNLIEACAMGVPVIIGPTPTISRKPRKTPSLPVRRCGLWMRVRRWNKRKVC